MIPPARPDAGGADVLAGRALRSLTWVAPIAVILAAVAVGLARGVPLAVLVLAAGALAAVIALFWQSVRTLVGETQLTGADAFALGTPHAEEERKRAVLRALKDLEFERSVGKISEEDYRELVTHYRAEAKRLLRQIDESARPRRDRVTRLVDERLRAAGLVGGLAEVTSAASPTDGARPDAVEETGGPSAAVDATRPACAGCGTANDPDAAFCKKCGKGLGRPDDTAPADTAPAATAASDDIAPSATASEEHTAATSAEPPGAPPADTEALER